MLADPAAQPIAEAERLPAEADRGGNAGEDDPRTRAQTRCAEHRMCALHGELERPEREAAGNDRLRGRPDVSQYRGSAGPARPQPQEGGSHQRSSVRVLREEV